MKGWGKGILAKGIRKQTGIAILISYKVDFSLKWFRWDKERHLILIKRWINQENITILSIYAPDSDIPILISKYANGIKAQNNRKAVGILDFYTSLSQIDKLSGQKETDPQN